MAKEASEQSDDLKILDQMTLALQAKGEQAELQHTGGGIYCIRLPVRGDEWVYWGTSDEVWGCDIYKGSYYIDSRDLDGVYVSGENIQRAADAIIAFTNSLRK